MDSPRLNRGIQSPDYRVLYYSNPDAALKIPVTLSGGFGVVPAGTILAKNTSASTLRQGYFVPYEPTAITGNEFAPGRAYLVADTMSGETSIYISIEDSYKFAVGDDVVVVDNANASQNLGAITAITLSANRAMITVTNNLTTIFTTDQFAHIYTEGATIAVGILEKSVDTGVSVNAWKANSMLILGNCVLYRASLENNDATSTSTLGITVLGQYAYMK